MSKLCQVCGNENPFPLQKTCGWKCQAIYNKENGTGAKKPKPIPKRSEKRTKEERLYEANKALYMAAHPNCEICLAEGVVRKATELHHKKGRAGKLLYDIRYFLAACHDHHTRCTEDSDWALSKGYNILRSDSELNKLKTGKHDETKKK